MHIDSNTMKGCIQYEIEEREHQENQLINTILSMLNMDQEFRYHSNNYKNKNNYSNNNNYGYCMTVNEPNFNIKENYDNYSYDDIINEIERLDPLGYDKNNKNVPLKIKYQQSNDVKNKYNQAKQQNNQQYNQQNNQETELDLDLDNNLSNKINTNELDNLDYLETKENNDIGNIKNDNQLNITGSDNNINQDNRIQQNI